MPLKSIAEDAGVSEAMIVKIVKKLGFSGFRDFRTALDDYNRQPTAELHQELSPEDTGRETRAKSLPDLDPRPRGDTFYF